MTALRWVLFDLNGTLLDPATMAPALGGGPDAEQRSLDALDDAIGQAMADTLTGSFRPLLDLLHAALVRRLALSGRDPGAADAALELAARMRPFPDSRAAIERLRDAGLEVGVLTNSAAAGAEEALEAAGLLPLLSLVAGADGVEAYKPDPRVYRHGLRLAGAEAGETCLVATHGWDVLGAKRAGMRTAWVSRKEQVLLETVPEPDIRADSLADAAERIAQLA